MNESKDYLKKKLKRAIERSELAYIDYMQDKRYFQALRIKSANEIVYQLLQEYTFNCGQEETKEVILYIFHLEDWMNQFKVLEQTHPELNETFVFDRLKNSPPFPEKFVERIKKQLL